MNSLSGFVHSGLRLQLDVIRSQRRKTLFHCLNLQSQILVLSSDGVRVFGDPRVFLDLLLEGLNFQRKLDVVNFESVDGLSKRSVSGSLSSAYV